MESETEDRLNLTDRNVGTKLDKAKLPADSSQPADAESAESFVSPVSSDGQRRSGKTNKGRLNKFQSPAGRANKTETLSNAGSEGTEFEENGSPVTVEALSENLCSLTIPKQLRRSGSAGVERDASERARKSPRNYVQPAKKKRPKNAQVNANVSTEEAVSNENSENDVLSGEDCESPPRFYTITNKVIVLMEERSRFSFTGKIRVKALYGAVRTYGYTIVPGTDPVEVYSPRGYNDVTIETNDELSAKHTTDIWTVLATQEGITADTENKLVADVNQIRPGMAVIVLSNLKNQLTKFLNTYFPFRLFPKIQSTSYLSWTDPRRAEVILQSNVYLKNSSEHVLDPRLAEINKKILDRWQAKEWSCTLITGGARVGKSTTSRFLVNSLLPVSKMVVLLDLDPGQTECNPPACISYSLIKHPLTGPNFTHLKTPTYQLYIGDVNVNRCLTRYISGVQMLIDKLSSNPILSRLPIIVNTMGYAQGLGWDITVFIIKLIRPSLVVQIMSTSMSKNFASYLSEDTINQQLFWRPSWSTNMISLNQPCKHELIVLRSQSERKRVVETWKMEPYQKRNLVMISYLSQIVQSDKESLWQDIPFMRRINDAAPFVAPFSSVCVSILNAYVPGQHALSVMNGNIVALCGLDQKINDFPNTTDNASSTDIRVLRRTPLCACYGFGIIRGVDMEKQELHINTPLSASMMEHVNYLIGCIPIPDTLLELSQLRNAPYAGGNDVVPTSREPRRGYFRKRFQNNG